MSTMNSEQAKVYKDYLKKLNNSYGKDITSKSKSCAGYIMREWLTNGISDEEAIAKAKDYNKVCYDNKHTDLQSVERLQAHRHTMHQWYGVYFKKENGKYIVNTLPEIENVLFFWLSDKVKD